MRTGVPACFQVDSLQSCEIEIFMVLEVLLNSTCDDKVMMEDNSKFGLHLRTQVLNEFSNTNASSPLVHGARGEITNADLVGFTREITFFFNKSAHLVKAKFKSAADTRRTAYAATLRSCCVEFPPPGITLLEWKQGQRQGQESTPFSTPASKASRRQTTSSLGSASCTSTGGAPLSSLRLTTVNGGRPAVTTAEFVMRRHAEFGCLLTNEKASLAYFTIGFHFTGSVPPSTDVMSPSTARAGILQLKMADNAFDALLLNKTLLRYPHAAVSFCFDATVEATDTRQSAFMRAPIFNPEAPSSFPELRCTFLGFNVAPSKGAKSNAEMTLHLVKEWAKSVEGLFERILIAFCWSVVDHAALPETVELNKHATKLLDQLLAEKSRTLVFFVGNTFPEVMRASGGDSFHKSSLAAGAGESHAFGTARGSKGNDVYSATQVCLDANYYECRSEGRNNTSIRLEDWCGKPVNIQKGMVKQRWESTGKVMEQVVERTKLESLKRKNHFVYPGWHQHELLLYTPSQYQYKLLGRTIAGFTDPRFVLVQLVLPQDIHKQYWKPANLVDRSNSKTGAGQGFGMRDFYENYWYKSIPFWENAHANLERYVPLAYQGLDDLRNYAHWFYTPYKGERQRFPVHQCVILERAYKAKQQEMVEISEQWHVNVVHLFFLDEGNEYRFPVQREEYLVKKGDTATVIVGDEDGNMQDVGDDNSHVYDVNELADASQVRIVHGLLAGRNKFREWHAAYSRAPECLHFLTVPGLSGAAARYYISLVKKHNAPLLPPGVVFEETNSDNNTVMDSYFAEFMNPTAAETLKGISREANETLLVRWIARFDLVNLSTVEDWQSMCQSRHSREADPAVRFEVAYPTLHVWFGYTIDVLGQTDYICEQANALLHELVSAGASFAIQDATMDYFCNVLRSINDKCRFLGTTEAEVKERRQRGEHVRLRPADSHAKRQLQVELVAKAGLRYTPELMARVPSRAQIAKNGTRWFNVTQIQAVLTAAEEKMGKHTLTSKDLEAIIVSHQDKEAGLKNGPPDEVPEDVARGLLVTSTFWSSVDQPILLEEVRWTLPHAHSMLNNRDCLPSIHSIYGPPEEVELWTEESGDGDQSIVWCLASCPRRTDGSGSMLFCEWGSCKGRCFHLSCVGLKRVPKGTWFCPDCSAHSKKRPQWCDRSSIQLQGAVEEEATVERPQKQIRPSVIWNKGERFTKTTEKRQNQLNFIKKQIKGYVDLFLGGRSTKTIGLEGGGKFDPTKKCPACKCLHAGGVRCYLDAEEDELFLSVFVRPFGKTIKRVLKAKNTAKNGQAAGLGGLALMEDDDDGAY